jgi:localization factor PodJL
LEEGNGVTKDLAEAARYYRMAADAGFGTAENDSGRCLEAGIGVEANPV